MTKMAATNPDTTYVKMYLCFLRKGKKPGESFSLLQDAGYTRTRMGLYKQIKRFNTTDDGEQAPKKAGPEYLLNMEQMVETRDWILDQNENHVPLQRIDVKNFVNDTFGITVTVQTMSNILARLGLSIKLCQMKTAGFKYSNSELIEIYWNFILEMKRKRIFCIPLREICSIDITHTTKPAGRVPLIHPLEVVYRKLTSAWFCTQIPL
jgi:hypothetical protein